MTMEAYIRTWNLSIINQRQKRIDPRPQYQRAPVWNQQKQQLLMDTILRRYDIPKVYIRKLQPGLAFEHEVVDGQQRLRAIWSFLNDGFPLGQDVDFLPGYGDLSGKLFSELPSDVQDTLLMYELTVVEILQASEEEIRDLFLRLQEGVTLNPAEKRNAMLGNMRDFIAETAENHRVFPLTKLSGDRFGWHDLLSHVVCTELNAGPTELKAANFKKMYEDQVKFDKTGKVAVKVNRILNYMSTVLKSKVEEMDIKWGFVDLYLALSVLDSEYVLKGREEDFRDFYVSFEQQRRQVPDPAVLLDAGRSAWDRDLYEYIEAFVRDGAKRENVRKRHDVYVRAIHNTIPDLTPKDSKRAFTRDERLVIWRRAKETCQICGGSVGLHDMHADHVVPHSKGGKTTIDNAQCLCTNCNLKKSAKI